MAETSDRISSLAAKYAKFRVEDFERAGPTERAQIAADIRSMGASLLRQDETKGLRGLIRKVTGRAG